MSPRVKLVIVSVVLAITGFWIYDQGTADQGIKDAISSSCDITRSLGVTPTSEQEADCVDESGAGKGKMLVGGIIMGLAAIGLIVAFVMPSEPEPA